MRLKDKVAIVTGAASGIGKAIALLFAKEGAKVVGSDLNEKGLLATIQMIERDGGEALAILADVSKAEDVQKIYSESSKRFGRVDILINNAGIVSMKAVADLTEEEWQRVLDIDLKSMWLMAKEAWPFFKKQGSGKIVNMSSIAGIMGFANTAPYSAAKAGILGLTRVLALEGAPLKINVNAIAPGIIKTAMTADFLKDPKVNEQFLQKIPMNRFGEPEDIAKAALFLASSESNYITGQVIVVDGGYLIN